MTVTRTLVGYEYSMEYLDLFQDRSVRDQLRIQSVKSNNRYVGIDYLLTVLCALYSLQCTYCTHPTNTNRVISGCLCVLCELQNL